MHYPRVASQGLQLSIPSCSWSQTLSNLAATILLVEIHSFEIPLRETWWTRTSEAIAFHYKRSSQAESFSGVLPRDDLPVIQDSNGYNYWTVDASAGTGTYRSEP
ncbi:hypothetical protein SCLCIDRAFT_1206661 [Scleroderma citrinum Foug A]|uniref:Uncharacterized protein n=1 Tax=Scleroderma citrinum Foug A TaxID=1036808 RepID=A0A0C3ERU4_9AGAM|nr:hypothetical protein SCLCIDRAFT_1206661 [Scleroderma citrinum Foug A]